MSKPRPRFYAPLLLEPGYRVLTLAALITAGFFAGYKFPRDVELESTAPVYFLLNADAQAAKILVEKCEPAKD